MKIFDSSPLIAIFNQFQYPQAFDIILQLGHELAVPHFVWNELKDTRTSTNVQRLKNECKLTKLAKNTKKELDEFGQNRRTLDIGEKDVILSKAWRA